MKPRALDLYAGAGGISVGLARAGFHVTGVDMNPKVEKYWRKGMEPYEGEFHCANALEYPLDGFDLICASPPCQRFSSLRHLNKGKEYPDLIQPTRERLMASGTAWCIENVEGAPLGSTGCLIVLCGTMFGLQTPDGRAELRRHRLFETSFSIPLRPACQHGGYAPESLSVCGTGMGPGNGGKEAAMQRRRAISVVGNSPEMKLPGYTGRRQALTITGNSYQAADAHSSAKKRRAISVTGSHGMPGISHDYAARGRETFTIADAQAAMGITWMPMRFLSQAIPPAYGEWIGRQALEALAFYGQGAACPGRLPR